MLQLKGSEYQIIKKDKKLCFLKIGDLSKMWAIRKVESKQEIRTKLSSLTQTISIF